MGIYDMPDAPYLEETLLIRADAALADALRRTADPIRRERLERERLSFEYVQLARLSLDAPDGTSASTLLPKGFPGWGSRSCSSAGSWPVPFAA